MDAQPEASRRAGLDRLAAFVAQSLSNYSSARNFDFGPGRRHNVSVLSPYIRHRLVLESEILDAALRRHSYAAADKFVQEIFWRAYFKGWLEQHPDVWTEYRASVAALVKTLDTDPELLQRYTDAVTACTDIECFDAWVKELLASGYLHNHARMWFASIWIFTLKLPWQLGADFLYRNLIDGDPASNTLSWRWVAGLHTKGKTYLAQRSNIARYTDYRFDPVGQLARSAQALTETRVFPIREIPAPDVLPSDQEYGLLITEEDASPETLGLPQPPRSVLGVVATGGRSPLPVGAQATRFAAETVADALRRTTQHFAIDGQLIKTDDWKNTLLDWARQRGLKTLVTSYAPVGPVAELLTATRRQLEGDGIRLLQVRRHYDSTIWPHAKLGYFKLKSKIPVLLDTIGIRIEDDFVDTQSEAV